MGLLEAEERRAVWTFSGGFVCRLSPWHSFSIVESSLFLCSSAPWPGELTYFPLCFQIPASAQHWGLLFSQNGFGNWMILFSITDASPTAPLAVPQKPSPCPRRSHRENLFPNWFPQILPLGFESILHGLEMVPPLSFIHLFIQQMFNNLLCARL